MVIAKWDKALDIEQARRVLAVHTAPDLAAADVPVLPGELDSRNDRLDPVGSDNGHANGSLAVTAFEVDEPVANATRPAEPAVR